MECMEGHRSENHPFEIIFDGTPSAKVMRHLLGGVYRGVPIEMFEW